MKHSQRHDERNDRSQQEWIDLLHRGSGEASEKLILAIERVFQAGVKEPALPSGLDVALILQQLGADEESIIAAILGDPRLRTVFVYEQTQREFGTTVADLVKNINWLNTFKEWKEEGLEVPEQAERLRRMLLAMVDDVRAVLIKLAFRIQRLRLLHLDNEKTRLSIARETLEIYAPLANRLGVGQVKWELEDLAFRYLEPQTYKQIAKSLEETRSERETYVQTFVQRLRDALEKEGIEAQANGRPKHIYSIWKKMKRKRLKVDELYDLRAVRVIVDKVSTCYAVLGVVHSLWGHIPQEFDDYIAHPKENGYQSLHTAVIGPQGKTVEVQIRTAAMDEFAESGVAAHWRYKEGGKQDVALEQAIASLRNLLENKSDDVELLEDFHAGLFSDRVFVLTPQGDILDLPKGATPLDFAYHVHTEVGHRCQGAKVNGRIVPLSYTLNSGEQVQVLTAKQAGPRRDWMNPNTGFLKTASARGKVRYWFRQQDHEHNLADGRLLLDREAQRLGARNVDLHELADHFHLSRTEDLLIGIGRGDISPAQLASALRLPELPGKPKAKPQLPAPIKPGTGDSSEIRILGVGNLLTQLAQCCRPVAGDDIIGYITQGKGVSIHRQDCPNILSLPSEGLARLVEVDWGEESESYAVDIQVEAFDRQGLLRDITLVLANEHANVLAANTHTNKQDQTVHMKLTLEVSSTVHLAAVLNKILQLRNIVDARRST